MKLLLCTDLDRTLLPNGPQPESPGARPAFFALLKNNGIRLVYVTGRSIRLTEEAVEQYRMPFPDILIADVGTTVCYREQGQWRHDMNWNKQLGRDWQQIDSRGIAELLRDLPGLRIQEEDRQTRFKLSYYVEAGADKSRLAHTISSNLKQRKFRATQIWSHDEMAEQELLDILPKSADKYQALQFLRRQMEYSLSEMLFAGDSGNDLEVLVS
ncbi:MAG: HAD-IIB family hydrolase, partial [Candidatus Electrothrix sp. AR4]|nr:HAD-IIB family hydrolase [Candidatus Electrothrix sp. AR4]